MYMNKKHDSHCAASVGPPSPIFYAILQQRTFCPASFVMPHAVLEAAPPVACLAAVLVLLQPARQKVPRPMFLIPPKHDYSSESVKSVIGCSYTTQTVTAT
ncbi:hypothetical protein E2C01_053287 [Portunus trituberculatus]|uniref:Uncharacterized protein n=1 Tax=Portunus trituberculatus TaxID=210409 RepID=A0A5B7GGP4_PORTR|nr:hypothetical protein [Portunus trituberculatus]